MLPRPRPDTPAPGQESAWAFPRPAVAEETRRRLKVMFAGRTVAETTRGFRVLETSHPPTYYFPPDDIASGFLRPAGGASLCEWKGGARYFDLVIDGATASEAAWAYANPEPAFRRIRNYVAFYAGRVEACFVDDEPVTPQEGAFYGGWITSHVTGPFKGPDGTSMW